MGCITNAVTDHVYCYLRQIRMDISFYWLFLCFVDIRIRFKCKCVSTKYGHSLISKWLVNYSQRTSQAVTPKLIWSAVICLSSPSSHAHFKDSFCVLNQCSKCLAWHCQWPQVSFNTAFHSSRNGPQHETTW